jgi:ribosomal protein S18 acetylase RimI-like enzyme
LKALAEDVFAYGEDGFLRPFAVERDLSVLADLIEVAFKDELQRTANPLVGEMRRLARLGPVLWLVGGSQGLLPPLMDGYVWIADGRLVGNVSLMRESGARGLWSISNVAVLPAYRLQGIARRLMEAAIGRAIDRGAQRLILEVSAENEPARHLYRTLGFVPYDTVHEFVMPRTHWPDRASPPQLLLRPRQAHDAPAMHDLACASTPQVVQEIKPVSLPAYGWRSANRLSSWLARLLRLSVRSAWVLEDEGAIVAVLQITQRYRPDAHQIDIMVHPQHRGTIERSLLDKAFFELGQFPLDLKASVSAAHAQSVRAFEEAGFESVRVLAQMTLDLRAMRHGVVL